MASITLGLMIKEKNKTKQNIFLGFKDLHVGFNNCDRNKCFMLSLQLSAKWF